MELIEAQKLKRAAERRIHDFIAKEMADLLDETGLIVTSVDVSVIMHTSNRSGERKITGSLITGVQLDTPI
jgi:hypothetical protein